MQRKPTKNTRGPNADEKKFQGWIKEQPCVWCGNDGPSIVDHARGATFKHNKVLIGHMFCLPNCVTCDTKKTIHGKRLGNEARTWLIKNKEYELYSGKKTDIDVFDAIRDWDE